jgi:MacB-like periplasmic core domain/FtsX-like permease family
MNTSRFWVAWYRFVATFKSRRRSLVSLIILLGLVGGLALGSVAAARRTESSFPAFIRSTNPSDIQGETGAFGSDQGGQGATYHPGLLKAIARLPHVKQAQSVVGLNVLLLGANGEPESTPSLPPSGGEGVGSVDGDGWGQNRFTAIEGKRSDPRRADEVVMNKATADMYGVHVGETLRFGVYTNAQTQQAGFGNARVRPYRRVVVRLVGIVVQNFAVLQDDTDVPSTSDLVFFTPALTDQFLKCCVLWSSTGILVDGGSHLVPTVQAELAKVLPPGNPPLQPNYAPGIDAKAERAIRPESIALGIFGVICGLAAVLIGLQIVGRRLRSYVPELSTMRALGADRRMIMSADLLGPIGAITIGSLLAALVAVSLSPLAPLGVVRQVNPFPGVAVDWTVLGFGVVALIILLAAASIVISYRITTRLGGQEGDGRQGKRSVLVRLVASMGVPESAVVGVRFAVDPQAGRNSVPVRSAIVGAAIAVFVVVGTITFGSSLTTLILRPALYGWNWDYVLTTSQGADIPLQKAARLLNHDPSVATWSGVYFSTLQIDGTTVPVIGGTPNEPVAPPLLSGHGFEAPGQVVLGHLTLAQLHKHVGDVVKVDNGLDPPSSLRIVGTATMPTIGDGGNTNIHTEMGTGALLSYHLIPAAIQNPYGVPPSSVGPHAILVRLRPGSDRSAALRSLHRIAAATSTASDFGVVVNGVQRPAEIVNYRSMGSTPTILGVGLAVGATTALGLTLMASVRRRQRELALLRTLGFTGRQLAVAVAWQSSVAVGLGTLIGVPLGIIAGRWLWTLFANNIDVVTEITVPPLAIVLVIAGALVLANVVAAIPGRLAARTPTANLLRAE